MQREKQKLRIIKLRKSRPLASIFSNQKRKTIFFSSICALIIIVTSFEAYRITANSDIITIGVLVGVISAVVPSAMLNVKQVRRGDSIDRNLPIFLLALMSSVQSGQSLIRAIEEAADRNMGSLTPELRNLRANLSWGMPIEEAFENFNNKVSTKLARRVTVLLQLAINVGGDVINTLEIIQKHVTEMQNIEKERKSALAPYIVTIYISFGVFLVITVILVSQFFTQIEAVQSQLIKSAQASHQPLGVFGALLGVKVSELNKIMLNMSIVEGVFGGLAAGKIGEGTFIGGIKHVIIMVVISVLAFTVVIR